MKSLKKPSWNKFLKTLQLKFPIDEDSSNAGTADHVYYR